MGFLVAALSAIITSVLVGTLAYLLGVNRLDIAVAVGAVAGLIQLLTLILWYLWHTRQRG